MGNDQIVSDILCELTLQLVGVPLSVLMPSANKDAVSLIAVSISLY